MKLTERIKSLIRRKPLTEEELAARADVEAMRERTREAADELAFKERRL